MAEPDGALPDNLFLLAGEHVLGVLEGEDLAQAQRLQLRDSRFAEAVAWWERRLCVSCEAAGFVPPSSGVWTAIEARLRSANDNAVHAGSQKSTPTVSRFSIAALTAGAGLAVASLLLFLATPRAVPVAPQEPPTAGPQIVAQISDEDAVRKIAAVIDMSRGRMSLYIEGFSAGEGRVPELWVIPADGIPISLGAIPEAGAFERDLSADEQALLIDGASLAVTFEDDTGRRHEEPSPPILLAGALDEV